MTPIRAAVALIALTGPSFADAAFDPDYYRFLRQNGLYEQAFGYAVTLAGSSDPVAETVVAYALLDGSGIEANPAAAIALACRSKVMDDFDVSKIVVQGNLRLASKDFEPIRCQARTD